METTHPGKRKFHNKADMQEWGEMNQWTKLEIVRTPALNHVEFKAYFINSEGQEQIHHEFSYFQKMHDRWYYVSGFYGVIRIKQKFKINHGKISYHGFKFI